FMQTDYSTIWLDNYRDDGLFALRSVGHFDTRGEKESKFFRTKQCWALHFVQRGKGVIIVRGKKYDIHSGMFFLTPPFEPVNYYGEEDDPWRYFFISGYPKTMIDVFKVFSDNGDGVTHVSKNPQKAQQLFEELFRNRNKSAEEMYFMALNALERLLSFEFSDARITQRSGKSTAQTVNAIKDIIRFNYKDPEFSIRDIADMLHINSSQLSRLFRGETGRTPISFLVELRLLHAAALLDKGSYSIAELCRESGFNDECYFMKRFKKRFGVSVKGYRKSKK
ncbi:MAG: helix-turn-helix domain-containing protein, partial [Oscillospiraceae bacterium]|nr:helix-turn-helix domain-containing protein [Oscillospiraceae bacterium]